MVMRYLGGVNSPSYNPLAANVTTGATTVKDGGIYTVSSAAQANGVSQWVNDQYFDYTTALLQADNFANGSQNNTFLDSSTNNFTVTRNGNSTQGSYSPFSAPNGYWSNFFDGTGDYLQIAGDSDLAFGTNNFTIECFFYCNTLVGFIYDGRTAGSQSVPCLFITGSAVVYYVGGTSRITSKVINTNQWYHLVLSRVAGETRMFLDGVQTGSTYTDSTTYINNTNRPRIGVNGDATNSYFSGYITNMRVVNGDGVTSVTVPTSPLTTVSNMQLLTCQNNRFVDNSSNAFPITSFGDARVALYTPFNNAQTYNGPVGVESVYFPGGSTATTNYGLINQALMSPTESVFTMEGWVYLTENVALFPTVIADDAFGDINWAFGPAPVSGSGNYLSFVVRTGVGTYDTITGDTSLALNTWYYIAVSCTDRNNVWLYVNGVKDFFASQKTIANSMQTDNRTTIGLGAVAFSGLISNLSVTVGLCKYPGGTTFSVPTAPLSPTASNQVLLFASPGPVDTNQTVAPKTITYSGTVTTSPTSPFGTVSGFPTAGGSAYFDGTGDYLTLTGSSKLAFGFNDFTIEFWFYLNALPVAPAGSFLYDSRPAADGAYPCVFVAPTTNVLTYYVSTAARITGTTAIKIGQWNHVVVSRVSGNARLFLNGAQEGSTYNDSSVNYLNGANRPVIANNGLNLGGPVTGYVSNLRVLNGAGVTTVTVPTAPLVPIQGTQLLLNGTNAGIYDASSKNNLETVGNAQVTTAVKKYGSGSMSFDGTGDWLLVPNNPDINLGTGDFTFECWVYLTNTGVSTSLIGKGTSTTGWGIYFNALPTLFIFNYGGSIAYSSNYNLNQRQWYHLAVTRSGSGTNNFKMFIDGFLIYEATITTDLSTTNSMYVGANRVGGAPFFGYIDDLRITKGVARYTKTFIPPATSFPRQGQG